MKSQLLGCPIQAVRRQLEKVWGTTAQQDCTAQDAPLRNEVQILRQRQLDRHLKETLRLWMGDDFAVPREEATAPLLTVLETPRRNIAHS